MHDQKYICNDAVVKKNVWARDTKTKNSKMVKQVKVIIIL